MSSALNSNRTHFPLVQPLSSMPESSEVMKRQKYYSSDSSYDSSSSASESEDNEKEEYQNKNRGKQVTYNFKQSNNYKLIQQSSKFISSSFVVI